MLTIADIAARLGEPTHRIRRAIITRRILPAKRVGMTYLFEEADVQAVADALRGIARVMLPTKGEAR